MRSTEAESFLFLGPTGPRVIDELVNREDQAHPSQKKKLGTWPHIRRLKTLPCLMTHCMFKIK